MNFFSRIGFRYKLLISFLVPVIAIISYSRITFNEVTNSLSTADWVRHTQEAITGARHLEKLMVDMEAGLQGFLIVGKPSFLDPYNDSADIWVEKMEALQLLVSDNPPQVELLERVDILGSAWMNAVGEHSIRMKYAQLDGELSMDEIVAFVESELGKRLMDKVRSALNEFIAVEEQLMILRVEESRQSSDSTLLLTSLVLPLLGIVFSVLAGLLLLRSVMASLTQLTNATAQISEGNFAIDLAIDSRDELGILASDFNAMAKALQISKTQLEELNSQLEMQSKYKSEFLANMSHEIRTPMNGVIGMLGLLQHGELSDRARRFAKLANASADSLMVVINDILDFSKIEAGKLDLEYIDFDLGALFSEFGQSVGYRAQEKGIEFVLDLTGVGVSMVKGDPGRLRQILNNLVSNAIKFTESGEVILRAKLLEANGDIYLQCTVEDTGIGIAANALDSLFSPFTQEDATTTRRFGGTGLGLAIVKQLCELMGGDVSVASKQGQGSTFTFHITLLPSDQPALTLDVGSVAGSRILIVDDNAINREVLRGQLEIWGVDVTEAVDGDSALDCLAQESGTGFCMAIIDMQMPGMDGAEVGRKIRADKRYDNLNLIMMTSMGERGDAKFFSELGLDGYFPKPVTPSDLYNAINFIQENSHKSAEGHRGLVTRYSLMEAKPSGQLTDARILLVDDNAFNQEVALGMLEDLGLSADVASNGQEAIDAMVAAEADCSKSYTLVLMDCQMPVLDGYEATRKIRSGESGVANRDIAIVAMTANAMKGDREKCLDAGMSDYLTKPIDHERLQKVLAQWVPESDTDRRATDNKGKQSYPDAASDQVVWDRAAFLNRVKNKMDRALRIVGMLLDDTETAPVDLNDAIEAGDYEKVAFVAHRIKGAAGNLGALKLEHYASQMEQAAKAGDGDQVASLHEPMQIGFNELRDELVVWREQNS